MSALGKGCGRWGRDPNAEGILGASWRRWLEDQKDFPACGGRWRSGLEVRAWRRQKRKRKVYQGSNGEGDGAGKLGAIWGVFKGQVKGYGCSWGQKQFIKKIGSLIDSVLKFYKLEASGLCEITQSLFGEVVVNVGWRTWGVRGSSVVPSWCICAGPHSAHSSLYFLAWLCRVYLWGCLGEKKNKPSQMIVSDRSKWKRLYFLLFSHCFPPRWTFLKTCHLI